jgi:hypothetical protein
MTTEEQGSPEAGAFKMDQHVANLMTSRNQAYRERAMLVAILANYYRASLEIPTDQEPGYTYVLLMETPTGQVSWHIKDTDLALFDHVPREAGQPWAGHDKATALRRLERLIGRGAVEP